jgi:hypothetical protein
MYVYAPLGGYERPIYNFTSAIKKARYPNNIVAMSSNPHRQHYKTTKAKQLSQKLQVQAKTGEKSPVHAGTSPVQTYATRTRSGKILAMTEPEPQPDKEFDEAGTDYTSFTKLHTLV